MIRIGRLPAFLLVLTLMASGCASTRRSCAAVRPLPEVSDFAELAAKCPAPRAYPFTNLVFEGGGVKGIAYSGVLEVLASQGILPKVERVAGTSAGSIAALFVALGYTPEEVRRELFALDFEAFEDGGGLGGLFRVFRRFGFFKGDFALEWLRCRVAAKTGKPNATFRDLAEGGFLDLHVFTTDVSLRTSRELSFRTTPDLEVALAVRMSMSIPLFFASIRGKDGAVFVDGGVLLNYPIAAFDGPEPNPATLGFALANTDAPPKRVAIRNLDTYAKELFETLLAVQTNALANTEPNLVRTAMLDDLGIRTTDFDLTEAQKQELFRQGILGTCNYLHDWSPERLREALERR